MNTEEAVERLEEHITNTVAVLPETLELEPVGPVIKGASCDDPTDGGSQDRVMAARSYWLTGLPVEDNEANAELLHQYWTDHGYVMVHDDRPDDMYIAVRNEEDAFSLALRSNIDGKLSISASSPCFWPEGTPPA
ncbi:hypothetical protein A6A08_05135 [Nocardiopsis sp. TSRI0078]|nr:hypothetical protein A6A08_05135 [Nocardiopsis sp. TSRI0078]